MKRYQMIKLRIVKCDYCHQIHDQMHHNIAHDVIECGPCLEQNQRDYDYNQQLIEEDKIYVPVNRAGESNGH